MPAALPTRISRRAATRRQPVIDDSDDDDVHESTDLHADEEEQEEEFKPAAQSSPRRQTRRKTTEVPRIPRTTTRTRKARTGEGLEPSQIFDPEASVVPHEPISPSKKASPRKRKSAAPSKKGRAAMVDQSQAQLLTPKPSVTPEPYNSHEAPLVDITVAANNGQPSFATMQKPISTVKSTESVLEEPMDIVIRSRALAPPREPEMTGPKARTVIRNLVLNNFKSYAGRQEVGPFHASFSSVVGPNGSGKSNVIDSLLFVFGFRASKMRQGKISALIHNSTAFPDLDHCEVEVHFQEVTDLEGGATETLPDSNLIISRRAFKNNVSKYYINGRESNFTTVTDLLKNRGVDLDHKRFLILQGEVESIAQMKPKAPSEHDDGLLEYLEDIIGTSKYKSPIEESATEVETLNEICAEKNARVQHVEKEKNGLEEKKNQALAYIRDENELTLKQSALYQVYIAECGDNLKVTEEAISQMQAQLNAELEKHQGNENGVKGLEKAYKQGAKELEALQKATQAAMREMAKFDKEHVKFDEKKKFLINKQNKLEKALQTTRLSGAEADSLIRKHSDDVERNSKEIAMLEKSVQAEEKELQLVRDSLKGKTQAFSDQVANKQKALEPWNEKINEKQSMIAVAQSELDILRERASAGTVAIDEIREKIQGFNETYDAKTGEIQKLQSRHREVEKEASRVMTEFEVQAQRESELRSRVSGARQKADEARASLSSTQSQGTVLAGLMRLKESGRIEGFHGRLGSLGSIDQRYDVAISTACPSLENLVVDSVEVGQQCIDYLRKNNLGRANFVLLDRLARRDLSAIATPEGVPRLFDLIKSKNDAFRPAFFSVLQNTLVANDLEQANRIAYGVKRWRVVTLDGQLIDVSGTMSGGGTRVARGGMSAKLIAETSKEHVSRLEVDRDKLEQDLQEHLDKQKAMETSLKEFNIEVPFLETTIQKTSLEAESIKRNIADAQRRLGELSDTKPESTSDDTRISTLEKNVLKLEKEMDKIRTETVGLEEEIQMLQAKIMEVGGVRLRAQKAKVDGLRGQIETLTEAISDAEVAKSKAEKQKAKHHTLHEDSAKELAAAADELTRLLEDVKTHAEELSESKRRVKEAQEHTSDKEHELANLKTDLDQNIAELNDTRAVEIEMRNRLDENQKVQSENQKRLHYWNEKVSKLAFQSISDFDEEQAVEAPPQFTADELAAMTKDALKGEIAILEEKTQNINVELGVLADYRRRAEEHTARNGDLQAAVAQRDTVKRRCDDLRRLRLEGFMTGFSLISLRLKEMYQMITMGGNAELELVDSLDPFSEGILFSVMPPKKSWKNISNLSGGEKTLSSLALVFALHHYKPTPLYVMDEIDAALDFRNVSRTVPLRSKLSAYRLKQVSIVASYIKERTKNAQFIVISLRNNMFELASRLVGVYKVNHMVRPPVLSVRFGC